ncbi:type II toxin-antitoxin system HipA family toxin [Butyrivibrio sp. AD3002]|uniref:type II toxin-antitoxin system HipA family toxin n=1 Tax=Butyrivibrio sp. AD3002 TaxID=1280670 RepID=UPI0003B411ED|nr:type II toxin-antitoxin system HipA family toxin [Butyrivibrio sp. AD3002]
MSDNKDIFVYAGWLNNELIGIIHRGIVSGGEVVSFEYDNNWLGSHSNLMLDPTIPQTPYRTYSEDKKLFGAFEDSCPDRWGRKLIERREAKYAAKEKRRPKKFFETDYLLAVQDCFRSGGFRYKTDPYGDFLDNDENYSIPPITAIRELEQISLGYEKDTDEKWLKQLVNPGSSLGGARPKANVADIDGSLWIAKFPSKNDDYDIGAWEKTANDLALMCGLNVPETKLMNISELGSTFLTKRFDRKYENSKEFRIHYTSAMTMLGARDGETDGLGYLDLTEVICNIASEVDKDLHELFNRMVFNIAISNHDDHLRNHGFILNGTRWELSPVFDINPVAGEEFLSMNIDIDNGYRSFDKALDTCEFYHLSKDEAKKCVNNIAGTITISWEHTASKNGIKKSEQKYMASAFELAKEYYLGL